MKVLYYLLMAINLCIGFKISDDLAKSMIIHSAGPIVYKFDYNTFKNKTRIPNYSRTKRALSNRFLHDAIIENIEVKFSWSELLRGDRLGSTFILRKGNKYIEYAMLYSPRDNTFTVRGLVDATGYIGEVRVIRNKEALSNHNITDDRDTAIVKLDTARIVTVSETKPMLDALAVLPESPIKLQTVSISLKLPKQRENVMLEVSDLSKKGGGGKAVVHIVPNTVSLVINDLPPQTIVKLAVRGVGGLSTREVSSINLFTGSINFLSGPKFSPFGQSSIPRIVFSKPAGNHGSRRTTVTCYVDRKPSFQGFPCKGSNVCIPLHWECDGDDDCQDGFDERGCQGGLTSYNQQNINNNNRNPIVNNNDAYTTPESVHRCRRNEFECVSRGVAICLPISWMCDGRTDCSDGWDEHKENCKHNNQHTTFPGGNSPNHNYNYNFHPSQCGWNYFKCRKGGCTPERYVCDGRRDCADGSDEHDCPDEEDIEDEDFDHCDVEYEFICSRRRRSRRCVPRPWVCDDQDDCPFGEDEAEDICRHRYHK